MRSDAKICLFGASPSTGNQGVNALCWSTLTGMAQRGYKDLHVFDYVTGSRRASLGTLDYTLHGMTVGKRLWLSNHLGVARLAASLGLRRRGLLQVVSDSDLVLDASGGDSFTDLYGAARFRHIVAPKQIALTMGRPLVLLPQTYGPFENSLSRRTARRLIDGSALAYARDPDSFDRLRDLLGNRFDPERHRLGVDLAFGLPEREPVSLAPEVAAAVMARDKTPLIGLNISGLVANRPDQAARRFGLKCDYRSLMRRLLMRLLDATSARLLLVPHVHAPKGHYESDLDAAITLLDSLPGKYAPTASERITILREPHDACELKWLIARCDWFCGTRMHATIAGISSGIPTAALAYSLKTVGVFKTCDIGDSVVDLRRVDEDAALELLMQLWRHRDSTASTLTRVLPGVRALATRQLNEIANCAERDWCVEEAVQC
jgi:polysaccharide pyruvyl transferase WcaK-like protein